MKSRILKVGVFLVVGLVALEGVGRFLQKPNRVSPPGDPEFLLATTWHQTEEYAAFAPAGEIVGCWASAIAQIAYYHRLSPEGHMEYTTTSGIRIKEDLGSHPIRFDRILRRIDSGAAPASVEETARYIFETAVAIQKDFGGDGIMDHEGFIGRLHDHLGATAVLHEFTKAEFLESKEEVSSLIRTELDGGRPLMLYFDNGKDWGHAAVVDGYVEDGAQLLVHLNMGWEGRDDGWYDPFEKIMGVRDDLQNRFLLSIRPAPRDLAVQRSALHWLLENLDDHPGGSIQTVCAEFTSSAEFEDLGFEVRDDGDRERLERFLSDSLHFAIKPVPTCEARGQSEGELAALYDSESGDPAAFFHLSFPSFQPPEVAEIEVGYTLGPHWGVGWRCRLESRGAAWVVEECSTVWVS